MKIGDANLLKLLESYWEGFGSVLVYRFAREKSWFFPCSGVISKLLSIVWSFVLALKEIFFSIIIVSFIVIPSLYLAG